MALVERHGRVYARKLWIFLGAKEWGKVRYHDEGYPAQGIDPRQFAAWARN